MSVKSLGIDGMITECECGWCEGKCASIIMNLIFEHGVLDKLLKY